jgi:nucleotide-binding universal stress UspA family protein
MHRNGQSLHRRENATPLRFGHDMQRKIPNQSKGSALNTILVPVDFSASSRRALKQALGLAGDPARVILLHVVAPASNEDVDLAGAIANARQKLKQFCESDGIAAPESIQLDVRSGPPFREILDCARQNSVEMIVLGVDGSSPVSGVTLGHTADRVSRYAKCPVLLVREGDTDFAASKKA